MRGDSRELWYSLTNLIASLGRNSILYPVVGDWGDCWFCGFDVFRIGLGVYLQDGVSVEDGLGERDVQIEKVGPFPSKQEAKEKLSERALEVFGELEAQGKVRKKRKGGPSTSTNTGTGDGELNKANVEVVNYIGRLLGVYSFFLFLLLLLPIPKTSTHTNIPLTEFQHSNNAPQPTYTDYQLGIRFSCEVTIEGYPQAFGSKDEYFSSKKAARQHAAGCAVDYFKASGAWPETFSEGGGIRKRKLGAVGSQDGGGGEKQIGKIDTPVKISDQPSTPKGIDNQGSSSNSNSNSPIPGDSYAARVVRLAGQLGLGTPKYERTSLEVAPGFHTMACYFPGGGKHEGPLGEVRHIFGKNKAKEECARLVLDYLSRVMEERIEASKRLMDRIQAGG